MWKFLDRRGMTQKKTAHASEQERADVKAARQAWCERQPEFDPERLFFVDESGLSTKMARMRGWAPKGQRCRASIPHGHWKTTTFVGALSLSGIGAPMLLDGAMDGEAFLDWCEQMLAPLLKPGDSVIMDNLPAHKVAGVREAVEATGATLIYLQPRLQPHRERLLQAQSPWAKGRRANRRSLGRRCRHSSYEPSTQTNAKTSLHTPDTTWINGNLLSSWRRRASSVRRRFVA